MKKRRFIQNALVMTAATFLMRAIGTLFQVYLSNRIGAEGIGLFQLTSSVYLLAVTLSTSGISLAVTRIVSEEMALNNPLAAKSAFRRCLLLSLTLGMLAGGLLLWGGRWLGTVILGDARTVPALRLLSFGLPFLATASVMRGYFLGLQKPIQSISGDAIEQLAMMVLTIPLLTLFLPKGLEAACCALVIGSAVSEAVSCLYSGFLCLRSRLPSSGKIPRGMNRRIGGIALPIAVSNYFRSLLTTLENVLVPPSLKRYGASEGEALSQYGLVKGMAMPILMLPAAAMSAFASLLVPEVASARAIGDKKKIDFMVNKCFQATLQFSFWVTGIFLCFGQEIGSAFYRDPRVGSTLLILTPLVPLLYLDQIVDSILKGLNQQLSSMKYNTMDSILRVLLIWILIPIWGMKGYLVMFFCGTIFNAGLSINRLIVVSRVHFQTLRWVVGPVAAIAASCLLVCSLVSCPLVLRIGLVTGIYFFLLRLTGSLKREDLEWGKRIFSKSRTKAD